MISISAEARGLTPEGERELIHRVTEAAAESIEREVERIVHHFDLGLEVKVAVARACFALGGAAGGYWLGITEAPVTERRSPRPLPTGPQRRSAGPI